MKKHANLKGYLQQLPKKRNAHRSTDLMLEQNSHVDADDTIEPQDQHALIPSQVTTRSKKLKRQQEAHKASELFGLFNEDWESYISEDGVQPLGFHEEVIESQHSQEPNNEQLRPSSERISALTSIRSKISKGSKEEDQNDDEERNEIKLDQASIIDQAQNSLVAANIPMKHHQDKQPKVQEPDRLHSLDKHAQRKGNKGRKFYHCCLPNKSTSKICQGTRISSGDIFKHLRCKIHFGEGQRVKGAGGELPDGVIPCIGSLC